MLSTMDILPHELVDIMMDYLNVRDRCHLVLTCTSIYKRNKYVLRWFSMHLQCMKYITALKYMSYKDTSARTYDGNIIIMSYCCDMRELNIKNYSNHRITYIKSKRQHTKITKYNNMSDSDDYYNIISLGELINNS